MTYEEIQNYPIGSIYKTELTERNINGFWYNQNDKLIIARDNTLTNLHFYDNNTYTAIRIQKTDYKIAGWQVDRKGCWSCVKRIAYNIYEIIEEEELINKVKEE